MRKLLLCLLFVFAASRLVFAVTAYNGPVKVKQPDGTVLTIYLHGDEYLHWATCGNSLVTKGSDGYWYFATFDADGNSISQGTRVTATLPGDGSNVTPPASAVAKAMEKRGLSSDQQGGYQPSVLVKSSLLSSAPSISNGEKKFLVLLIEFSDKSFTRSKNDFVDMLNSDSYSYNAATGSAWKYYNDVSFGRFSPSFDVYGPIRVSYTSAQCAVHDSSAVIQACRIANDSLNVDFTKYCNADPTRVDNVFFFFPGYNQAEGGGSDTIWPHSRSLSVTLILDGVRISRYACASEFRGSENEVMAGIGTFCHEFGHVLGLPDLYDTDYEVNGQGVALQTLALMSSGNYNNEGRTPPYMTYEEKKILGWDDGLITLTSGLNVLSKTSANKTYYTPTTTEGEYYLYESRPNEGWDSYIKCRGLAIYHVDRSDYVLDGITAAERWRQHNKINAYSYHQCMDLVETIAPESAVKTYGRMTFPGVDGITSFTSQTSPASKSWNGVATGYNIRNINFNSTDGTTKLYVDNSRSVYGVVKNTAGQVLSGVAVSVEDSSSNKYETLTDSDGCFATVVPNAGNYSVSATKEGYLNYKTNNVAVDDIAQVNFVMSTPLDGSESVLKKYSAVSDQRFGFGSRLNHYAGLKYTADEMSSYVGSSIKSISFMADNGGNGTVDKMGVQVYFDDVCQCDCESPVHVFGTTCTVDISERNLMIPSGKSVTFVYYLKNSTFDTPVVLADYGVSASDGSSLINNSANLNWQQLQSGRTVISASITVGSQVIDLSGINFIPRKQSYSAGETFELTISSSSVNPPSSVTWTVNGEDASGSLTLSSGTYTIQAHLTFQSGRQEIVETRINVK